AHFPLVPERAELPLAGRRRPITAPRRGTSGITAGHRRAVERVVERVLVHREPPPERLARTPAPRPALLAFDEARRLSVHVRPLTEPVVADRPRLEREPGFDARAADAQVALQRGDRAIRRASSRHGAPRVRPCSCRSSRCRTSRRGATGARSKRWGRRS